MYKIDEQLFKNLEEMLAILMNNRQSLFTANELFHITKQLKESVKNE